MNRWSTVFTVIALALLSALAWAQPNPAGTQGQRPALTPELLAKAPAVTVDGTMKKLEAPEDGPVRALLISATEANGVVFGPSAYLLKIGLTLQEGDQVQVAGWTVTWQERTVVVAREITAQGKTYPFRDAQGKPLWARQDGPQNLPTRGEVVTVSGTVKSFVTAPAANQEQNQNRPAPVRCMLTTDKGTLLVGLGPQQMLEKIGLALKVGDQVTVTGPRFTQGDRSGVMAQTVVTGGKTFTLPRVENVLANAKPMTATGTAKNVVLAPDAQQPMPAHCTLTAGAETYTVVLGPAKSLAQLGLALKDGDQVTVAGWLVTPPQNGKGALQNVQNPLLARTVTVGGKTVTLRDENGKAAWETPRQNGQNAAAGQRGAAGNAGRRAAK